MDYFPLSKVEKELNKKTRRYRGTGEQEKEHGTLKPRKARPHRHRSSSPLASGSTHRSRGISRNVPSGRNSPHLFEGRRSPWERNPFHGYQSRKDEGYRHGDRIRPPKGHYDSRRGSGAPPPVRRSHQGMEHARRRSRSPSRAEMRRRDREEQTRSYEIILKDLNVQRDFSFSGSSIESASEGEEEVSPMGFIEMSGRGVKNIACQLVLS